MSKSILLCALVLFYSAICAGAADRIFLEVFPYALIGNAKADTVEILLRGKLEALRDQTLSAHPELTRLEKITVVPKTDRLPPSPEALAHYWTDSSGTLEILSGAIYPDVVASKIYLGELHGSLKKRTVAVQIALTPHEFGSFSDMHGALMLYALAMDAKAHQQQRGIITQFLAEAESLLTTIKKQPALAADEDMQALADAVAKEIDLLKK